MLLDRNLDRNLHGAAGHNASHSRVKASPNAGYSTRYLLSLLHMTRLDIAGLAEAQDRVLHAGAGVTWWGRRLW